MTFLKFQEDIVNGITDVVSGGSNYDSPPYTVIGTHSVGSNSVSSFLFLSFHLLNSPFSKIYLLNLQFEERRYEGGKNWACNKMTITSGNTDNGMFENTYILDNF